MFSTGHAAQRHIDLVGLLYIVAAALSTLVAVAVLALGVGALTIGWSASSGERGALAAQVTGATFIVIALVLFAWSAVNAVAGRAVRRRKPWARTTTLVLAILNLFILPFGTALALYSLWVLLTDDAREAFVGHRAPHAP